jgi:DNA-directed RNA polymerase subunit M
MFCPKCKSLVLPRPGRKTRCKCGWEGELGKVTLKEKGRESQKVEVVDKDESVNVEIDSECPKCGHSRAEYWEVQTRSSDEPPTRFHRCKNCRHTWREYS